MCPSEREDMDEKMIGGIEPFAAAGLNGTGERFRISPCRPMRLVRLAVVEADLGAALHPGI